MNSQISYEFCQQLPKIELHAHLNGCVRKQFLKELSIYYGLESEFNKINEFLKKDIEQAFKIFEIIYKVVFELENIKKITEQMIEDFQSDNVIYLEIRTTPKELSGKYTKEQYIETILNVIKNYEQNSKNNIIIRLLLCIDRGQSLENAQQLLTLLKKYKQNQEYSQYIVGVDLCGNPYKNKFQLFKEVFKEIRKLQLKISIHTGELEGKEFLEETQEILNFKPDRIGHFNYFNQELFEQIIQLNIPIEMCPTSNLFTLKLKDYTQHHFIKFFQQQHPLSICTDGRFLIFVILNTLDTCVFDTNLSNEIYQIGLAFNFSEQQIRNLMLEMSEQIFDDNAKSKLQMIINNIK